LSSTFKGINLGFVSIPPFVMHAQRITTLGQFIIERQAEFPYSKGQL
jgi:hypothetical protein